VPVGMRMLPGYHDSLPASQGDDRITWALIWVHSLDPVLHLAGLCSVLSVVK
jgi:hypothetical protein